MTDKESNEIVNYDEHLADSQKSFLLMINSAGLPTDNIFVPIEERARVFKNASSLLEHLKEDSRINAVYISKFFAAVAAGLFDAALNYIWDETVLHLRKRIESYDLEYFYDIAASEEKRKTLKSFDDMSKLTDDELLRGSRRIELISEAGYKNIDLVKYMRNNASAAHPNQLDITGIKLIAMAEDCLKEVISMPIPAAAIEVKRLLDNIKTTAMKVSDANDVATHFPDMDEERTQKLAKGIFSIFCRRETQESSRQNIRLLTPLLWPFIDEETRENFGVRHANFSANSNIAEKKLSREFLTIVGGLSYMNDQQRAVEILALTEELDNAHSGLNNFYNEDLPAKKLFSILGDSPQIPAGAESKYIRTLVNVFLTNGYGVANSANEKYTKLISGFTPKNAIYALTLVFDEGISSKLRRSMCQDKFFEMLDIIELKISTHAAKKLITTIRSKKISLSDLINHKDIKDLASTAVDEIK